MTHDIRHELTLNATPAAVHAAVATPDGIRGWWAKDADLTDSVGGRHELRFDKEGRTVKMGFRVDALEAGRVAWTCTDNGNPVWVETTLEWRIAEAGDGETSLVFEHAGFAEGESPPYQMTVGGWQHFVASLVAYVETGAGQPW